MCETNDSNGDTAKTNSGNNSLVTRFWPLAADSSSNGTEEEFDRVWDDAELIAQYNKTEAQVKVTNQAASRCFVIRSGLNHSPKGLFDHFVDGWMA